MRLSCLLLPVALVACSRANPAFDGSDPVPMEGTGGDEDSGDETPPAMVTTDSVSGSMTGQEATGDPSASESDSDSDTFSGTTGLPETSDETGSERMCPLDFDDNPFVIELSDGGGAVPLDCPGGVVHLSGIIGVIDGEGTAMVVNHCGGGTCTCAEPVAHYLEVEAGTFPWDGKNICADVYVRANEPVEVGDCAWESFAVLPRDEAEAVVLGANALSIPSTPSPFVVDIDEDQLCGPTDCGDGTKHPGDHNLQISGATVDALESADVTFNGDAFSLTNRMAHVTPDCETHVSWYALGQPGG